MWDRGKGNIGDLQVYFSETEKKVTLFSLCREQFAWDTLKKRSVNACCNTFMPKYDKDERF